MRALREWPGSRPSSLNVRQTVRRVAVSALCAATVACAVTLQARRLPDRDASLLMPQGMLVTVERATFFQDGGLVELQVRNSTYEVTRARIRVVVFDDRQRLRGSVSYCTGVVQPGTRQPILIPLEVRGADVRDSYVVYVEEVLTARRRYSLRETLPQALAQARNALQLRGWELTTVEEPRTGDIPECPCECEPAERVAREACGEAGLVAFTCTPMQPGCSAGVTCKR
jgi:hypothetical protein